ncbi:MAG: hypothetical protein MUF34_12985 [Polyangiaceae bacterium]|nr:hypothetical protein [Polyangiaceae bacterium]
MARFAARLALGLAVLGAACRAPLADRISTATVNGCQPGAGEACAGGLGRCLGDGIGDDGVCFANRIDVSDIVVEVRPTAASSLDSVAPRYARFDILADVPRVALGNIGVQVPELDLFARRPVEFGSGPWPSPLGCNHHVAVDGSLGMRATLRPAARREGVDAPALHAQALPSSLLDANNEPFFWALAQPLTPGDYDIYLEPLDDRCPPPPVLVRGYGHCVDGTAAERQACARDGHTLDFNYVVRRLSGSFLVPPGVSLEGWTVEVVDGPSGLPLSTAGVIGPTGECPADGGLCPALFGAPGPPGAQPAIEYSEVYLPAQETSAPPGYLRLSPPAGVDRPTFVFVFSRVAPVDDDNPRVFPLPRLPGPNRNVSGRIETVRLGSAATDTPIAVGLPGVVWFRSRSLIDAPPGVPTLMQGALPTDAGGAFLLPLPAGAYEIVGVPVDRQFGRVQTDWAIPERPDDQGGRILSVSSPAARSLRVLDPSGARALSGLPLQVSPVPSQRAELDVVQGVNLFEPRTSSATTDDDGTARLVLDSGRDNAYVLTVPFERKTGLPWLVLPSWPDPTQPGAGADSEALRASLPWEISGRVVLANTLADPSQGGTAEPAGLEGGVVRVYGRSCDREATACDRPYVLIGSGAINSAQASAAVEGVSPRAGTFTILLPSTLLYRETKTFRCVRTQRRRSLSIVGVRRPFFFRRPRRGDGP